MIESLIQKSNRNGLRVIKTAKTIEEINKAAGEGFRPLMKQVVPSDKIKSQICLIQNTKTGEVKTVGDQRSMVEEGWEVVLPFFSYYPRIFPNPYAAYLIPADIKIEERVFLEEVIEDIPSAGWQGSTFRLASAEAVWDGKDFIIPDGQTFEKEWRSPGGRLRRLRILG